MHSQAVKGTISKERGPGQVSRVFEQCNEQIKGENEGKSYPQSSLDGQD